LHLNLDTTVTHFTYWCVHCNVCRILCGWREVSGKALEKIKHALDKKYIFFFENSAVYEIITNHTAELEPVLVGRSAAARLLRSWVRIPRGAWMSVCCECYVLSGRGLCDELITLPEESYRLWRVVLCDQEIS
jgi:hypothetical protein